MDNKVRTQCEPILDKDSLIIALIAIIWSLLFFGILTIKKELEDEKRKTEYWRKKYDVTQEALTERFASCECDI